MMIKRPIDVAKYGHENGNDDETKLAGSDVEIWGGREGYDASKAPN